MTRRAVPIAGSVAIYDLDDGTPWIDGGLVLRGHLTDDDARGVAADTMAEYGLPYQIGAVRHTYARSRPLASERRASIVTTGWPRAPGAYPVTVVEVTP